MREDLLTESERRVRERVIREALAFAGEAHGVAPGRLRRVLDYYCNNGGALTADDREIAECLIAELEARKAVAA